MTWQEDDATELDLVYEDLRQARARIEVLEAALQQIADPYGDGYVHCQEIARAVLVPEQDK